ncbi:MAG: DUF4760 domain-containing protein [Oscillospiraceae bacterium]|nr:DUF4760 domain-containing protein [Oscillospiraceae bacterium]
MSEGQALLYLKDMEFFCIGVNSGIYDFGVSQRVSVRRLLAQYQTEIRHLIEIRRQEQGATDIWCEYERVMQRLECHYCSSKNRFRKFFCKKRL